MGTDIHSVFQKKVQGEWIDISTNFDDNRHYKLFAWLAGVRNGYGFAGVYSHEPITPISKPRGLPADFLTLEDGETYSCQKEAACPRRREYWDSETRGVWMGDHSHSWLRLDEILEAQAPCINACGVISIQEYKDWDKVSQPESYCGMISGLNINVAMSPEEIIPESTHVRVFWKETDSLQYFIDEIKRIKEEHADAEDLRMVFGFDS